MSPDEHFSRPLRLSAGLSAVSVLGLPGTAWAANTGYVMAYFTESPQFQGADYGLHLAVSRGGLNWTPLNPGLADSAGVSFQSVNLPDSYLRHANYLLRIDPLSASSSAADRQDATFRVTF